MSPADTPDGCSLAGTEPIVITREDLVSSARTDRPGDREVDLNQLITDALRDGVGRLAVAFSVILEGRDKEIVERTKERDAARDPIECDHEAARGVVEAELAEARSALEEARAEADRRIAATYRQESRGLLNVAESYQRVGKPEIANVLLAQSAHFHDEAERLDPRGIPAPLVDDELGRPAAQEAASASAEIRWVSDREYEVWPASHGAAQEAGEPPELASLPVEVRRLIHAVDRMRDRWADADADVRGELWTAVHHASDLVWGRFDSEVPSGDGTE
jgi:hypothetical protein